MRRTKGGVVVGGLEDMDFGPDTEAIRRWLAKRATYADDAKDQVQDSEHGADAPPTVDPQALAARDAQAAGREVLDALAEPEPPAAHDWPAPAGKSPEGVPTYPTPPKREYPPKEPQPHTPYSARGYRQPESASRSTNVVFKPRRGVQRAIAGILAVVVAATAVSGYVAYREQTTVAYGITAILGFLTLVVWAVRAGTPTTELAVIRGQLEMIHAGRFEVIDLSSPYTPVLVEGEPGRRGWKVLIERPDRPLLVIDRSVVDPEHFSTILYRLRPDVQP